VSGPFQVFVEITHTIPFFVPIAEIDGVAPGFSNFLLELTV